MHKICFNKKDFILMSIWVIMKNLKKNYQAKKIFIVLWPAKNKL